MADTVVPHFQNDRGDHSVEVGVKEFMCVGASPPFDHPHVFLDMGEADDFICPYCGTLYRFQEHLHAAETNPPGHLYEPQAL